MNYSEIIADVTKMPQEYVIAHCISCDCAMGAGVVIPLIKKFPQLKIKCIEYTNQLPDWRLALHKAYRYSDSTGVCYNMFSKVDVWRNAERGMASGEYMSNLRECLTSVKEQMKEHNETHLALPKIACGLDRCVWEEVSALIQDVFADSEVEIVVCCFK